MMPFCQTSMRSRILNRSVIRVEKKPAIIISAAKTLPYSAQPCAQLTYQPRPDLTPTDSAATRVRKEAPSPMNKPIKMFGTAAGIATRKIRYARPAPRVRATSKYEARVLEIPDAVSIVTGNQTESAISPAAETIADGEMTKASGIHAVAGL